MCNNSELTASDLHAWFLVYCASTRSGSFLESKTRGSRWELVLYHKVIKCWCILKSFLDLRWASYFMNTARRVYLDPLKNPFDSFFSQGNSFAFLLKRDVQFKADFLVQAPWYSRSCGRWWWKATGHKRFFF